MDMGSWERLFRYGPRRTSVHSLVLKEFGRLGRENCHHIELPATRNLSIEFGKMEKMKLPCCGDEEFDEREFTVYYSLSVPDGDPLRRTIK